jgi:HPt (histidine-containing phosphotransfer) domain-containing protein
MLTELRTALDRAEPRAVAFAAHALKGSSSVFGAHRLEELCGEMERAGQAGQLETLVRMFPSIEREVQRVLTAVAGEAALQPT